MHHSLAYDLFDTLWLPVLALVALIWLDVLLIVSGSKRRNQ
jgi:hypothetical protein